jgi:hypothetical protein
VGGGVVVSAGRAVCTGGGASRSETGGVVGATETAVVRVNSGVGAVAEVRGVRSTGVVRAVARRGGVRSKTVRSVVRAIGLGVIRVNSGIKLVQHVRLVRTRSGLVEV